MRDALTRICITGPESTGKTTLARRLAEWLGTAWVAEGARVYAERVQRELLLSDVVPIAREHVMLAEEGAAEARARGSSLLVLDTDLVSTAVYARHYYATVPREVLRAERERRADLYLLCDVDVPWESDGVRDRPENRGAMFSRFRAALRRRGANIVTIRGDWGQRWTAARDAVSLMGSDRSVTG